MQRVLMQIQLTGNLGNTPIPVDHTMRCLDRVAGDNRTPRTRRDEFGHEVEAAAA
jgi:hypothetical protein